jgi:hypothetical protein
MLGYVPRLRNEPDAEGSLELRAIGGVVVNLTGPPQPTAVRETPTVAPRCRLEGEVDQRTLRNESAARTLGLIEADEASRWLLARLPLMQGGADPGTIERWQAEALRGLDERDRATLANLTLVFAELGGCLGVWESALEGWNVQTSPYLDRLRAEMRPQLLAEVRDEVRDEVRAEVRNEVRAEARVEEARAVLLRLGRQRFGKAPTRKQAGQLEGITDLARLERMIDRLLQAASWGDLLATP